MSSHRIVSALFVSLDRIALGELPNFTSTDSAGSNGDVDGVMWSFRDCTVWLRRDQINEVIAKLVPHIPELPVKRALREMIEGRDRNNLPAPPDDLLELTETVPERNLS